MVSNTDVSEKNVNLKDVTRAPKQSLFLVLLSAFLIGAAYFVRRNSFIPGAIFHDDGWVATSINFANWSDILNQSFSHPGLIGFYRIVSSVFGVPNGHEGIITLIVSCLLIVPTFFILKAVMKNWYWALFATTLLYLNPIHISYSGRIKAYIFEIFFVLFVGFLVHKIREKEKFSTGKYYQTFLVLAVIGFTSLYSLVIASFATLYLFLTSASLEKKIKILPGCIAMAGFALALYIQLSHGYNSELLNAQWAKTGVFNRPMDFNFVSFFDQIAQSVLAIPNIANYPALGWQYPFVTKRWLAIAIFIGAAIILSSKKSTVFSRFIVLLFLFLLAAVYAGFVPLGGMAGPMSTRLSLVFLPIHIIIFIETFRIISLHSFVKFPGLKLGLVFYILTGLLCLILGLKSFGKTINYPMSGQDFEEAIAFAHRETSARNGKLILIPGSHYQYAAFQTSGVTLKDMPKSVVGFIPVFEDPAVIAYLVPNNAGNIKRQLPRAIKNTDTLVLLKQGNFSRPQALADFFDALEANGFQEVEKISSYGLSKVYIWKRVTPGN